MRQFLLLGLLLLPFAAYAEETPKPIDTKFLRELSATRSFSLGRPTSPKPTPDGKAVLFLRSQPRSPANALFELDVATGKTRELLTPAQVLKGGEENLSPEEKARRERMRVTARGFASFQLSADGNLVLVSLSGKLFTFNRTDGKIQEFPTSKGTLVDPKFAPDGNAIGYVLDNDVYVLDLGTLKEHRVTTGGTEDVAHGVAEFVAQEEMDRHTGWWWSPDSQWIVFEEADNRDVEIWEVADPSKPGQLGDKQRYPRPGKNNTKVRLGIVSAKGGEGTVKGGEPVWIKWDEAKYPYLATVRWDKGGPLTILVQARSQQEAVLLTVEPLTGSTTGLHFPQDNAWLNLDQQMPWMLEKPVLFDPAKPNINPQRVPGFLNVSDTWIGRALTWIATQPVEVEVNGKKQPASASQVLVHPQFHGYVRTVSVDEDGRYLYFLAHPMRTPMGFSVYPTGPDHHVFHVQETDPTELHLYRVGLDDRKTERLSKEPGVYNAVFSKNHAIYVLQASGPKQMQRTTVHRADGSTIAELPSVAETPPFVPITETLLVAKPAPTPTKGQPHQMDQEVAAAAAGYFCSVTRPRGFVKDRKYPVIVDVYGGPQHQHVTGTMSHRLKQQWLADQGFIVVAIDGRGTPNRGRDWERAIRGSFGNIPLDDQVAGLKLLAEKFPELDLSRVGITGWSFGGYMSALAVMKRPEVFKAGVAGAPVADWQDYDTHYTERYLGLPNENTAGYHDSSLLTYAKDLKRPLLVIHGTRDDNVYFVHSLKLSDALFRAGKEHEVLPLSGFTHMVADPLVRERLEERIVRFFQKHLQEPTSKP